jgi:hypothetical protein
MRKLRIVEKQFSDGDTSYEIQKRRFGFLWWVNASPWEHLGFDSLDQAKKSLCYYADPSSWPRETIVYQNFEDEQ